MTREEITGVLSRIDNGEPATDTFESDLQSLARVVAVQEQRLRAVEPCPGAPVLYADKRHAWDEDGKCIRCEARKFLAKGAMDEEG